jgi:undecaprenyl-diphosphatase
MILAMIPAGIAGLFFEDLVAKAFDSLWAAGIGFLITGAALWYTRGNTAGTGDRPSVAAALGIGVAQAFAILPGVSRSGLTLAAALALGVAPIAAAEFSFLMSVAAISGAAIWALPELLAAPAGHAGALSLGAATALVSGVGAIWFCIRLLSQGSLHWFAYYTWAAGLATLLWLQIQGGA